MLTDLTEGITLHHTSASAAGILNHGGTLILNASKVDDNTAAERGGDIADDTGGMALAATSSSSTSPR